MLPPLSACNAAHRPLRTRDSWKDPNSLGICTFESEIAIRRRRRRQHFRTAAEPCNAGWLRNFSICVFSVETQKQSTSFSPLPLQTTVDSDMHTLCMIHTLIRWCRLCCACASPIRHETSRTVSDCSAGRCCLILLPTVLVQTYIASAARGAQCD